jgi:hypothetical protein
LLPGRWRGWHYLGVVLSLFYCACQKTLVTSSDQAVLVDQTGGVGLPSDAVLVEIDRFG